MIHEQNHVLFSVMGTSVLVIHYPPRWYYLCCTLVKVGRFRVLIFLRLKFLCCKIFVCQFFVLKYFRDLG